MENSLVREFFKGKSVFITGATGFVGKVLVEKLLRYCDGIDKIYLLIRTKKGQSIEKRFEQLLNSKLFSFAIDINKVEHKVVPICGDLTLPHIGLKASDRKLLISNVAVVIHVAGDVKLNETIREAVTHNLIGIKLLLNLCKDMHKLEALVHTSTAYTLCQKRELEEKIYAMKTTPEEVIQAVENMDDYQLDKFVKPLLEGRPNYYTFAKALAEHLVLNERGDIPTAIVRPSIVMSSYEEPVSGWTDSFGGATGILVLASLGVMRISTYEPNLRISLVPVDWTCNALIASAWFVATHKPKDIQIYHMASEPLNSPSNFDLMKLARAAQSTSPSMKVVRPAVGFLSKPSKIWLWLTILISHLLFAYFVDAIFWIMRCKPIMISMTKRMHTMFEVLEYFWTHSWNFHSNNTRNLVNVLKTESPFDAHNLKIDLSLVDWQQFIAKLWIGFRRYLLKESDESIPIAEKRLQKIIIGYRLFLFFWYSLLAYGFYWIISGLFTLMY